MKNVSRNIRSMQSLIEQIHAVSLSIYNKFGALRPRILFVSPVLIFARTKVNKDVLDYRKSNIKCTSFRRFLLSRSSFVSFFLFFRFFFFFVSFLSWSRRFEESFFLFLFSRREELSESVSDVDDEDEVDEEEAVDDSELA